MELQTAHELAKQCLSLVQSAQDPVSLVEAHQAMGISLYYLGELAPAREHLEQSIALYDPQQHRSYVLLSGIDPKVICLSQLALTLWHLGYPDQALQRTHEALTLARERSHPQSLAHALNHAGLHHQFRREERVVQELAEAEIALSREKGFPYWLALGAMYRGWAWVEQGQIEEGIVQIRQGLAAYQATGAGVGVPYFLIQLAEAYGKVGQVEEGLALLDEALTAVDKTGERWWEAELYRIKGELLLNAECRMQNAELIHPSSFSVHHSAEECFHKALEVARRQQARSLELRAAMSLSRLWQKQSKKEEARQMLAEIYGWFTEGFDTADLKEAKKLLEELS